MEQRTRSANRDPLQPAIAALLGLGILLAVATDGRLPTPWSGVLFGALVVLDLITIGLVTRPGNAGRSRAATAIR